MCAVIDARRAGLERGNDISFDLVARIYRECDDFGPVIDWIGGEPLLYRRIGDLLQLAAHSRSISVLTTNGLLLGDYAAAIARSSLPVVQISLDGWDDESQRLRGNVTHSFERIVKGVAELQRARAERPFPILRVLTATTRHNYQHLDKILRVVHELGIDYWGIANYFYVNEPAMRLHRAFALEHGLTGSIAGHAIEREVYLSPPEVVLLEQSLCRVREQHQSLGVRIAYNWKLELDRYYSTRMPSKHCTCELPYSRLDIHTDGSYAVCVSGKTIGNAASESILEAWHGVSLAAYRRMYQRNKPMPMCFRCCGMSNTIRFDP